MFSLESVLKNHGPIDQFSIARQDPGIRGRQHLHEHAVAGGNAWTRRAIHHGHTPAYAGKTLLATVKRERSNVALISARQGNDGKGGFGLSREIRNASSPATRVIMLLDSSERTPVLEAFRAGARGVFCRTEPLKLLAKSIRCVHEGQIWASSSGIAFLLEAMAEPLPMSFVSANGDALFSARELDVVRCVAEGLTNREIAQRLTLARAYGQELSVPHLRQAGCLQPR